ncbi:glycoside hydrolase family 127 protein [Phytoactinopolyspora halotolerans]|uniref:Glycoside hydrolase family 127 protein n=1 Tax=Phytoactinopolyspora halotolerans TaxID=1981512 RepID=A0A6L9S7D5_9ACTN|nr:glycoside hydrolase family 127 protein [Phytoactinopolyspora halotolerans]
MPAGPAIPRARIAVLRPLDVRAVRLGTAGALGAWQERNADATIPHCVAQLEASGVLDNFRRVVGESDAEYRGFVFADSDLYKVIEAVAWEIARSGTRRWDTWLDDVIGLVARVQDATGYVMTWIQGVRPEKRFAELEWTHEMYILGHMIQAAVALDRAAGRDDLLRIARRFADLIDSRFGPEGQKGVCGHPEIETALVELYRHTGERRYLTLAQRMIDLRGTGLLPVGRLGARYFQDHAPVREATTAVGHAVRQLYLNCGVTDLYLETGEPALMKAQLAQWVNAHKRKQYITGAFGSRHRDEAFGDDYELPSDRAYAETCASIADLHWSWRILLATGDARYADTIERELYNAIAASVDATGTRFFYSNPLQLRPDRYDEENAPRERAEWYACACCPPNVARLIAQLSSYTAALGDDELRICQYTDCDIELPQHVGDGVVHVRSTYPASGVVDITLNGRLAPGFRLALRVPRWSNGATSDDGRMPADADGFVRLQPGHAAPPVAGDQRPEPAGQADEQWRWRVEFDVKPRWTRAHPRVDAVRGCVALERGPVVYCVEQADLPPGVDLDDVAADPSVAPSERTGVRIPGSADAVPAPPVLEVAGELMEPENELYRAAADDVDPDADADAAGASHTDDAMAARRATRRLTVSAIPFGSWGNRTSGAMRVWLPAARYPLHDLDPGDVKPDTTD